VVMVSAYPTMTIGLLCFGLLSAKVRPMKEVCREEPDLNNRWLLVALGGVVLLVAWSGFHHFWAQQAYLRLGLLALCVVFYWFHCTLRAVHDFYERRQYRGYFLVCLLIVAGANYISDGKGMPWLLAMPVLSQALLYLPVNRVAGIAAALFLVCIFPSKNFWLPQAIMLLSSFTFTGVFSWMLRRERDSRQELHTAHEKLREYSAKAETLAAAEERARLAREIHDGVAHHLTSANVLVAAGLAQLPASATADARDSLEKAQGQIRAALGEIRQSIAERRDAAPVAPLAQRIEALIAAGNFPATFTVTGTPRPLTTEAEHGLYRVAQEALTNARKHAPTEPIAVQLTFTEPIGATLRIDNREPAQSASGDGAFGLLSLRERLTQLGGRFTAGPTPAGRFVVEAEIPA
jgi:signal transduction histidine kinase